MQHGQVSEAAAGMLESACWPWVGARSAESARTAMRTHRTLKSPPFLPASPSASLTGETPGLGPSGVLCIVRARTVSGSGLGLHVRPLGRLGVISIDHRDGDTPGARR